MSKFLSYRQTTKRNKMKGGGTLSSISLILYILLKYPIKYGILLTLFAIMIYLVKRTYYYVCLAVELIISAFKIILEPGDLDLIIFKVPDLFQLFMAFKDLMVGFIYFSVALVFFIILGLVTLPFNMIFPL